MSDSESEDSRPAPPETPSTTRHHRRRGGSFGGSVASTPASSAARPLVPPTPATRDSSALVPPTPGAPNLRDDPTTPLTPLSALDQESQAQLPHGAVGQAAVPPPPDEDDDDDGNPLFQAQPGGAQQFIRGTDIHVATARAAFVDFIRNFKSLRHSQRRQQQQHDNDDDSVLSDDSSVEDVPPLYLSRLQALITNGTLASANPKSLEIDTMHIYYHSPACQRLYRQLVHYPCFMVPILDVLVQKELERMLSNSNSDFSVPKIQVRPYNLKTVSNLRCLDPVDMDSLVAIKGMIVRSSPIIPDLKIAHFSCVICGHSVEVEIDRGKIAEPTRCTQCTTKHSYQIVHNRGSYADKQLVRIQETPDKVPAGQTPASVTTFCFDDLVDSVQPGDKVEVTGVLRAQPVRVHPKVTKVKSVYKTYVDVIHFRRINGMESDQDKHDLAAAASSISSNRNNAAQKKAWTEQRVAQLKALSRDPDIYVKLTSSLAPSIWELDNVKQGVLCMLFGGNQVRVKQQQQQQEGDDWLDGDDDDDDDDNNTNRTASLHKRGDINILLCGDPGTSKSQLLTYVHKLSHRGVYTSGKGSSAVGLTASVVRDPETRDLVLESGALVLSDRGICCIDEFDKMTDTTRSVLHEAMEQQTVSIAKAGIIATLRARTSVLASANPTESRYNPNISVVENIQLPPTLLSRFDLIYLILDSPNVENDRRLAQHLVGLYYETPNVVQPPLDQALLRDYIQYAREQIHPEISDDAASFLIDSYLEMRNPGGGAAVMGANGTRTISATPRQLESLVRLSEALAKMRYSTVVTRHDAREAVRLMKVATQAAATDPRTGRIDMDMIATGRSSNDRQRGEQMATALKELLSERRGSRMAIREVSQQLGEITNTTPSHDDVMEALRRLEGDGMVQLNERAQTIFVRTGLLR